MPYARGKFGIGNLHGIGACRRIPGGAHEQVVAFGNAGRLRRRDAVQRDRGGALTDALEQVCTYRVQPVACADARVGIQRRKLFQAGRGPMHHRRGNRMVQTHDRIVAHAQQHPIERKDLRPVGVPCLPRLVMHGRDGCLDLVRPLALRTKSSFGVMLAIALCWIAYAAWTLANRRTLLARHRVIAARMAMVFCAAFGIGALAVGLAMQSSAGILAAATGAAMFGAAVFLLRRAYHVVACMQSRRAQLEARLGDVQDRARHPAR